MRTLSGGHGTDYRLRVRCWIDGRLIDETWIDCSHPDAPELMQAAILRHEAQVMIADLTGGVWLVEIYDPDTGQHRRVGTDAGGMVEPRPVVDGQ